VVVAEPLAPPGVLMANNFPPEKTLKLEQVYGEPKVPAPVIAEQDPVSPFESVAVQAGGEDEKLPEGQFKVTLPDVDGETSWLMLPAVGEATGFPLLVFAKEEHL
jgi:hypothetical protein